MTWLVRILIIEDHLGIQTGLKMLFELEGYEAVAVDRGEEALRLLGTDSYDIVLLDLHTNGISAFEFMEKLKTLRNTPEFCSPLVGLLSGSTGLEFEARRLGVDFSIKKPFVCEEVIAKLREAELVQFRAKKAASL